MKRSHTTAATLHFAVLPYVFQLFLYIYTHYCPCARYFHPSSNPQKRTRPWSMGAQLQREDEEGKGGGRLGMCAPRRLWLVPGCGAEWRLLFSVVVFSFIQPSRRTPFRGGLVDGRRRSTVEGGGGRPTIVTPTGMEVLGLKTNSISLL